MPIDPRIALMGTPVEYDTFGAMRQGQEIRQNQMAMQAAQDTAARNTMLRELQGRTDFTDRNSVANYMRVAGAEGAPVVAAMTGADTMFNTRAAEERAGGEYARKARGEDQGFMQRAIGAVYTDPSDANIAAVAAQAVAAGIPQDQMDAYVRRIVAAPVEQRRSLLANELATSPEGLKLLERFTPAYDMQNAGGSIVPVQTNQLAPGATPPRPIAVTADPTKYTDIPTADGNITRVYADGRSEILRGPTGAPLAAAPTPAQQQADAEAAAEQTSQANARQDVNGTLESMMAEYDNLYRLGAIVSTDRTGPQNVGAAVGASLPGRVAGRALGLEAQTARDNIAAALPQIMLGLQTASGLSSTQLNSNAELQFFKRILGDPDASYQTVVNAIERFQRFADSLLGGAGGAAPPTPRAPPQAGEVRAGYRFRGGDPGNQTNWTPVR
jgi:hypothetical protein